MGAARAKGLDDDAPVAKLQQAVENLRPGSRNQLQQKYVRTELIFQLKGSRCLFSCPAVLQVYAVRIDFPDIRRGYAFKGVKAHGPHLYRAAAAHNLIVKGHHHPAQACVHRREGRLQVPLGVGKHLADGNLRSGQHHRFRQVLQHIAECGSRIRHGICAMGDDDTVIIRQRLRHLLRHKLPFLRLNIGAVQIQDIPAFDREAFPQLRHPVQDSVSGHSRGQPLL